MNYDAKTASKALTCRQHYSFSYCIFVISIISIFPVISNVFLEFTPLINFQSLKILNKQHKIIALK